MQGSQMKGHNTSIKYGIPKVAQVSHNMHMTGNFSIQFKLQCTEFYLNIFFDISAISELKFFSNQLYLHLTLIIMRQFVWLLPR